jgi:5'-phosphate synthase pdxT subunit
VAGELHIGVLALQGDVREHAAALSACGASVVLVRRPSEIDDLDGIVIPGGESTTMSKLLVDFGLYEPLRKRVLDGLPAYGSCAGLILLSAEILDGRTDQVSLGALDVSVRRNAFGRQVDSFEADLAMPEIGDEPMHAVFIRAPWVESVGSDVDVLGRVEGGSATGRIVAVRQGDLLATSFHPELTGDSRVHWYFVSMVRRSQRES